MTFTLKFIPYLLALFVCSLCFSQKSTSTYNFNFEKTDREKHFPEDWFIWGKQEEYTVQSDSLKVYSGNYAAQIFSNKNKEVTANSFAAIAYAVSNKYSGSEVQLEGYIKTSNIENGRAALLLRLDKKGKVLTADNMEETKIDGTRDWTKYSITLPLHKETELIYIGGVLSGTGKAWFDDFSLSIDGKLIEDIDVETEFAYGSKFAIAKELSSQQIDNLYELCKKWGYLKYHHPKVAKGDYNWDHELFRILKIVKSSEFNAKLNRWVSSFEPIDTFDLESHHYIDFVPKANNPIFKNESTYKNMHYGDTGIRLLALFRYWNMIEYFFPYKHLIDKDWDMVLKEYIPKIVRSNSELSYKLTILQLIGEISDTHANIWQSDEILRKFHGTRMAPFKIQFVGNTPVVSEFPQGWDLDNSLIKVGDVITAINGMPVEELIEEKIKYCPASNKITQLRDVARRLLRTNEQTLEISFLSDSGSFTESINSYAPRDINFSENHLSHEELDGNIGYIYPGELEEDEIHDIMKGFMDKEGLVIDLRCYPSDFIVFKLGEYLMPNPVEFVKFTNTSLKNPGTFEFTPALKVGKENPNYYKGKVVILINETSQSQAEYTAMALRQAPKAVVIGSQTAGADGNTSRIILPGNIFTMISGIGVYYPDGTETQRIGIVPDIEIHPTLNGIQNGKDEVMERAIQYLKTGE